MYKYFSNELIENVLFNNTLRFTQPEEFNDPFECSPVINRIAKEREFESLIDIEKVMEGEIEKLQKSFPTLPKEKLKKLAYDFLNSNKQELMKSTYENSLLVAKEGMQPGLKQAIYKTVGVFCLSENRCEHLMWAHYANNHKGFLVKFDTNNAFFNNPRSSDDICFRFDNVEYYNKRQKHDFVGLDKIGLFYEKDACWEYENEWRVVKPLVTLNEIVRGVFIEKFDWDIVEEVIIGTNCSQADQVKIVSHIRNAASHVELMKARISSEKYEIIYDKL